MRSSARIGSARTRCTKLCGALTLLAACIGTPVQAAVAPLKVSWDRAAALSKDAQSTLRHVYATQDNGDAPFVVIDKRQARLWVFDAQGRPQGSTPVLLGFARGDHTVPGIGDKPLSRVRPGERTTPAGRFVGEHGRNLKGDDIIWVDYDAAVSMHRVKDVNRSDRREQRLRTRSIADNRISYGCINIPKAFYEQVLKPVVGRAQPVVYLLPETRPVATIFGEKPTTVASHARAPRQRSD
ncbi:MAG TPA: L,D-transpeptidase [Burkholderiaceae bacterium]|nr:L,D-transpeptidase [Burkholderiaceae bacterium]